MASVVMKLCHGCGIMVPVSNFKGDICKACASSREKAALKARKEVAERRKASRKVHASESVDVVERPVEKVCIKCGRLLPIEAFRQMPSMKDGRDNRCMECVSKATVEQRKARAERKTKPSVPVRPSSSCVANSEVPDLKPCPFCGKIPLMRRIVVGSLSSWEITCGCFDAQSKEGLSRWVSMNFESPMEAAEFWNRRSRWKA